MNHTNQPWVMHPCEEGWDIYSTESEIDHPLATVHRCDGRFGYEDIANAKLMRAAPVLLEMCKRLHECADYWSEYDVPLGIVDDLKKAIEEAT